MVSLSDLPLNAERHWLDADTIVLDREGRACRARQHPEASSGGRQAVLRLELHGGQSMLATRGHPLRTRRGWVPLVDLQLSDEVAVLAAWPARHRGVSALLAAHLPQRRNRVRTDQHWVQQRVDPRHARLLGLIAAGGQLQHAFPERRPAQSVILSSLDPAALDEAQTLAAALFPTLRPHRRQRHQRWYLHLVDGGAPFQPHPLRQFLRLCEPDLGFPRRAFALPEHLAEIFAQALLEPALGGDRPCPEPFLRYLQLLRACLGQGSRLTRHGPGWRLRPAADPPRPDPDLPPLANGEQLGWSRVRALAAAGQRDVWALTHPTSSGLIANGLLVRPNAA